MSRKILLEVKNLKQYFPLGRKSVVKAVDDVSFHIYEGETFGLVGESGSGKSTTGRTIIRLYDPTGGEVIFDDKVISNKKLPKDDKVYVNKHMQMIFQDPMACLNPRMTVMDIIAEGLDIHGLCKSKEERYNRETLQVKYKDKTIADVLDMNVEEALKFFENIPNIKRKLETLMDVGLSYIKLGQPSTQLSGGEAQRIKLATELSKRPTGKTLYILDEPTTGLHMADVDKLIQVLQKLADTGNSIVVIEHNLDVIKTCDYIIDLGPEGGDKGGKIVATGTPEEVSKVEGSYTGKFLKKYFE